MSGRENVHATGLVIDGTGLLIRGASGSGKSLLALALLDDAELRGQPAVPVADDRLDLEVLDGALVMHAPERIAGMIELRGRGIVHRPYVASAPVHLLVDLLETLERMPQDAAFSAGLLGVRLPRCPVPRLGVADIVHQRLLVREAISALRAQAAAEKTA